MISLKDFEKPDGRIDWVAYNNAEEEAGERCYKCKQHILFGKGGKTLCNQCKRIENIEEFDHDCFIRCPKCKEAWNPSDEEYYDVYESGEHEITCMNCSFDFTIETHVSYSFTSPALKEGEENGN